MVRSVNGKTSFSIITIVLTVSFIAHCGINAERIDAKMDCVVYIQPHQHHSIRLFADAYKQLATYFEFGQEKAQFGITLTRFFRFDNDSNRVNLTYDWILLNVTNNRSRYDDKLDRIETPYEISHFGEASLFMTWGEAFSDLRTEIFSKLRPRNQAKVLAIIMTKPPGNGSDQFRAIHDLGVWVYAVAKNASTEFVTQATGDPNRVFMQNELHYNDSLIDEMVNVKNAILRDLCRWDSACRFPDKVEGPTNCVFEAWMPSPHPYMNNISQCDVLRPNSTDCEHDDCVNECDERWPWEQKPSCDGKCGVKLDGKRRGNAPQKMEYCPQSIECPPCSTSKVTTVVSTTMSLSETSSSSGTSSHIGTSSDSETSSDIGTSSDSGTSHSGTSSHIETSGDSGTSSHSGTSSPDGTSSRGGPGTTTDGSSAQSTTPAVAIPIEYIIGGTVGAVLFVIIVIIACVCIKKKKSEPVEVAPSNVPTKPEPVVSTPSQHETAGKEVLVGTGRKGGQAAVAADLLGMSTVRPPSAVHAEKLPESSTKMSSSKPPSAPHVDKLIKSSAKTPSSKPPSAADVDRLPKSNIKMPSSKISSAGNIDTLPKSSTKMPSSKPSSAAPMDRLTTSSISVPSSMPSSTAHVDKLTKSSTSVPSSMPSSTTHVDKLAKSSTKMPQLKPSSAANVDRSTKSSAKMPSSKTDGGKAKIVTQVGPKAMKK